MTTASFLFFFFFQAQWLRKLIHYVQYQSSIIKQGKSFAVAFFLVFVKVTDTINTAQVSPHIKESMLTSKRERNKLLWIAREEQLQVRMFAER